MGRGPASIVLLMLGCFTIAAVAQDPGMFCCSKSDLVLIIAESLVRCCYGDEDRPFSLACPPGTAVASVDFAVYGDPSGYCGNWLLNECSLGAFHF